MYLPSQFFYGFSVFCDSIEFDVQRKHLEIRFYDLTSSTVTSCHSTLYLAVVTHAFQYKKINKIIIIIINVTSRIDTLIL